MLNNLLYVLNYSKDPDKTISIASSLIEKTNQADIKYDALRFLAYAYKVKGDLKSAEAAIEQIPEIYFTKLTEMAYLLEGKPKYEAAEKQKWISFENLIQMMEKLAEYYELEGMKAEAIKENMPFHRELPRLCAENYLIFNRIAYFPLKGKLIYCI